MKGREDKLREKILNLIDESCDFLEMPNKEYQKFHKSLLKYSFEAIDVEIDYENKSMRVRKTKPSTSSQIELYNSRTALLEIVNYTDLKETLIGCYDRASFSERFYKQLVCEYENDQQNLGDELSA